MEEEILGDIIEETVICNSFNEELFDEIQEEEESRNSILHEKNVKFHSMNEENPEFYQEPSELPSSIVSFDESIENPFHEVLEHPENPINPLKRKFQEIHNESTESEGFSSHSPSFESIDDENSISDYQNYGNYYQQDWEYHNYLQQQSHYGFYPQQYSNYSYNVYPTRPPPTTIAYIQKDVKTPKNLTCESCSRAFKTTSNLMRHFQSKTHKKKVESRKKSSGTTFGPVTDVSEEERKILWQIDDEIWEFLEQLEFEKNITQKVVKKEIFPTPPLTPSGYN